MTVDSVEGETERRWNVWGDMVTVWLCVDVIEKEFPSMKGYLRPSYVEIADWIEAINPD